MKEWYLMESHKPNVVSGYEGDILSDFAQSNFNDVLETTFSDSVILYNYDLSESKEIRCVIQGNSADTHLNSVKRVGLFPIGTVKTGMYVYFDNTYWLITGYPSSNKSYEKVSLDICQYKLKWQNSNGDIIERWGNFTSASKYDDGLKESKTLILSSDNLNILLPNDKESLGLAYKRVFVDTNPKPEKVYIISRTDDVLYDFGEHGGILSFIADKTEFNATKDNQELGICDYIYPASSSGNNETTVLNGDIVGVIQGNKVLKVGFKRTYKAVLTNKIGTLIGWNDDFYWNIYPSSKVKLNINNNTVDIFADNESLIGQTIAVEIMYKGVLICSETITISESF